MKTTKIVFKVLMLISFLIIFTLMSNVEWYYSMPSVIFVFTIGYAEGHWDGLRRK